MPTKRLLMMTGTWPPIVTAGTHRPLRLARRLPHFGWGIDVLTPHPKQGLYDTKSFTDESIESVSSVNILYTTTAMPRWQFRRNMDRFAGYLKQQENLRRVLRRIKWRPDFFDEWTPAAVKIATLNHTRVQYDAIWVTGGPWGLFPAAQIVANALKVPLVLDYRDPWTASPDGPEHLSLKARYQRRMEADCVEMAAGISFVHPRCLDEHARIFGRPKNATWTVITNGYEYVDQPTEQKALATGALTHAGQCYGGRSAIPVLKALDALPLASRPITQFFGSLDPQSLAWLNNRPSLASFEQHEHRPNQEIQQLLRTALANILIVGKEHSHAVPSKLFDYMLAKRPILGIGPANAEARNIVKNCQLGEWFTPDDIEGISKAMMRLQNHEFSFSPIENQIENYSADKMAERTSELLDTVVQASKGTT